MMLPAKCCLRLGIIDEVVLVVTVRIPKKYEAMHEYRRAVLEIIVVVVLCSFCLYVSYIVFHMQVTLKVKGAFKTTR